MADTSKPPARASAKSSVATDLCPRCGMTYAAASAHSCAGAAVLPEFSPTLSPDTKEPVDRFKN